jgi:hypothetical protein
MTRVGRAVENGDSELVPTMLQEVTPLESAAG